jgi:hypothetical protein
MPTPTAISPTSTGISSRNATRASTGTKPVDGSNPATEWQGLHAVKDTITLFNPGQRLYLEHEQLAVQLVRREQPEAKGLSELHVVAAGKRARPHAERC